MEEREKRASVGIGIAFILLALTVSTVASVHLAHEKEPEHVSQLVGLSAPRCVRARVCDSLLSAMHSPDMPPLLIVLVVSSKSVFPMNINNDNDNSIVIFLVLGIVKYRVGSLVDSPSLKKDGICSLCGAGLSFGMCLGGVLSYDDVSFNMRRCDECCCVISCPETVAYLAVHVRGCFWRIDRSMAAGGWMVLLRLLYRLGCWRMVLGLW